MAEESKFLRSTAKDASGGKYKTDILTYPEDLFGTGAKNYSGNWVMININVMSGTSYTAEQSGMYETVKLSEAEEFAKLKSNVQDIGASKKAAIGATVAAQGIAGAGLANLLSGGSSVSKGANSGSGFAGGIASGLVSSYPIFAAGTAKRETKRLASAIQLPMPNNLGSNYSMEWNEDNTKMFDMILRAGAGLEKAITSGSLKGAGSAVSDAAISASLGAQNALGAGALSAATGMASNPKKEMIFNGVNFRQFRLDYKFYPRTAMEAWKVWFIIRTLKFHMHPEYRTSSKFTFIYPSEFDITFYGKGGVENPWIARVATCVLRDLNVNYTPEALWASHSDGFPNSITLSLNFQELAILTKNEIEKGY